MRSGFHIVRVAAAISVFISTGALAQAQTAPAQSPPAASSPPAPSPTPVCVYNSARFSDGAYLCAQKSMMLTCRVDGTKATWTIVTDKEINEKCTAPAATPKPRRARRHFTGAQVYWDP